MILAYVPVIRFAFTLASTFESVLVFMIVWIRTAVAVITRITRVNYRNRFLTLVRFKSVLFWVLAMVSQS